MANIQDGQIKLFVATSTYRSSLCLSDNRAIALGHKFAANAAWLKSGGAVEDVVVAALERGKTTVGRAD